MIAATREDIAEQLWLRDEPDLALRMLAADDATHRRVMVVAAKPTTSLFRNQVDELLVAAAIKVLTGRRRRPRRWDPRPDDELDLFWQQVGPERDRRDHADPSPDVVALLGFLH